MSEIFYIIALSFGSIITIFILTKLMGYRQMSQMSMFDYINGITIGSRGRDGDFTGGKFAPYRK